MTLITSTSQPSLRGGSLMSPSPSMWWHGTLTAMSSRARKPEFFFRAGQRAPPLRPPVTEASYVGWRLSATIRCTVPLRARRGCMCAMRFRAPNLSNAFVVSHGPARVLEWSLAGPPVDDQPVAITLTLDRPGYGGRSPKASVTPQRYRWGRRFRRCRRSGPTYTLWSPLGTAYPPFARRCCSNEKTGHPANPGGDDHAGHLPPGSQHGGHVQAQAHDTRLLLPGDR